MEDIKKLFINKINYKDINPLQKENYNYCKAIGILADYGFECVLLSNDWSGADLLAIKDNLTLRIQLKSRFTLAKKYRKKELYIMFFDKDRKLYLFPHDAVLEEFILKTKITESEYWKENKMHHSGIVSKPSMQILGKYIINI